MALLSAIAKREGSVYRLTFKAFGDAFTATIAHIKGMQGRRFDPESKTWTVPATGDNLRALAALGFALQGEARQEAENGPTDTIPPITEHPYESQWNGIAIDETMFQRLFQKQIGDLKFFEWTGGMALLCGEVGYGKTVSGLSWLKLKPELRPALIVTRANLKRQWQNQWGQWVGDGTLPEILSGETPRPLDPNKSYVINREILHCWEESLTALRPRCVIGDECQDFGNDKALQSIKGTDEEGNEVSKSVAVPVKRTQAFVNICRNAESLIMLSATPFNTRIQQFFTVLNLLMPRKFSNKWAYQMRYCDAKRGPYGWDFTGASNLEELHRYASRVMLFRDRDRTNETHHQTLILDTEMDDATRAKELAMLKSWDIGGDIVGALERLEEMASAHFKYKRKAVAQWLKGLVDNGEKVVVFGRHRAVLETIAKSLGKKGCLYYGGMGIKAREASLQAFTKGSTQVLVANMEAAGVGLDGLQHVCHRVAFAEIPTAASTAKQCIGRVDRTHQTKDVDAIFLVGEGTADELTLQVLKENWGVLDCLRSGAPIMEVDAAKNAIAKWKNKRS